MCGKFTLMASWRDVHAFSQPLTEPDSEVVATPMRFANIIRLDAAGEREVVSMRWCFAGKGDVNPSRPKSAILPASKIGRSADDVCPNSIIEDGKHLSIDYYALGKANTVSPTVFETLWSELRPFNPIISAATDGFDADDSDEDYVLDWAL